MKYRLGLHKVCSCPRARWRRCAHSWHVRYQSQGRRHSVSLEKYVGRPLNDHDEAETIAVDIRKAIRTGAFHLEPAPQPSPPPPVLTVAALAERYQRYLDLHRPASARDERWRLGVVLRTELTGAQGQVAFGDLAADAVTVQDIQQWIEIRRLAGTGVRGGLVSINRALARVRAMFTWAVRQGLLARTPFKIDGISTVALFPETHRHRRLLPDEADQLFAAAGRHLKALIQTALDTGCRLSELLSAQWWQVRWAQQELFLPAEKTKDRDDRYVPLTQRVRALLELRQYDSEGKEFKPDRYVFGDETGGRIHSIRRAWETCVLKAHGIKPVWAPDGRLTLECRQQYRAINLHFHDLRREAGSRLLETGADPHLVQVFLGHANLSTTSRYLAINRAALHRAVLQLEAPTVPATTLQTSRPDSEQRPH